MERIYKVYVVRYGVKSLVLATCDEGKAKAKAWDLELQGYLSYYE